MSTELQLAQVEKTLVEQFEPTYSMSDYDLYSFSQIWPNPDIGLGNDNYEADTLANTYVFVAKDMHIAYVFFDTHFAYTANPANKNFKKDLENEQMTYALKAERYTK